MANQILVIAPYWHSGAWVFDDPAKGLDREPFVLGIGPMIDHLTCDIPNARSGFRLLFSAAPFPSYQQRLEWRREELNGNWYWSEELQAEGWLCPALFRYFDQAPREIYVKAEGIVPGEMNADSHPEGR